MAPSETDNGKDRARNRFPQGDQVGPARPRWPEPRTKTPIAVALDYKRADGTVDPKGAPRISATGRGAVARQILEIAFAKGIPVREDPDLAQILGTLDVDSVIPVDALAAVAEILSYLYRINGHALAGQAPADEVSGRGGFTVPGGAGGRVPDDKPGEQR